MKSRRGVTLLEVLVSIFIMGIGMLAILVLFPLGALNMARALKDDRTGTIAPNADSLAQARGLRNDTNIVTALSQAPQGGGGPPTNGYPTTLDPNRPTYPVIIDPYYASQATAANGLSSVGTVPTAFSNYAVSPVQRISPSYLGAAPDMDKWFSFQDDLTFETSGLPLNWAGGGLQRQGWYTWAYCLQRQLQGQPNTTDLMTVIVYKGRPIQTPSLEPSFQVSPPGNANDATLSLVWSTGAAPDLVKGNWLMDCTPVTGKSSTRPPQTVGYAHGKFYRVMDAFVVSPGVMQVEVYPPLLDANVQWVVVMEYASEIFTRGTGR